MIRDEWKFYVNVIGFIVVKKSKDGMDLIFFWKFKVVELFEFYKIVFIYCIVIIIFCDVERFFFFYNEILDEKRRFFDFIIMKVFYFFNWNIRVKLFLEKE